MQECFLETQECLLFGRRGVTVFHLLPLMDLPLLHNVLPLMVDSHELLGLARMLSSPTQTHQVLDCSFIVFFSDYVNFPTTEWNARE